MRFTSWPRKTQLLPSRRCLPGLALDKPKLFAAYVNMVFRKLNEKVEEVLGVDILPTYSSLTANTSNVREMNAATT